MAELSKCLTSWIIILDRMTGNVVMSEVDVLMYVVLSKAEMHVPYGGLVGNVINEVSHKLRSLQPSSTVFAGAKKSRTGVVGNKAHPDEHNFQ